MGPPLDLAPGGPICFCWHREGYLGGLAGQEGWVKSLGNLDATGLLKGDNA